jgi:hypothetical protein
MMPIVLRLREYVEAANVARERARSARKSQAETSAREDIVSRSADQEWSRTG